MEEKSQQQRRALSIRWLRGETHPSDRLFKSVVSALGGLVVLLLVGIALQLVHASSSSLDAFGWDFIFGEDWDPAKHEFGVLPFVFGTLLTSFIALLLATPIAMGSALFLSDFAPPWVTAPADLLLEFLAAIPSVVYGLWGLFVLAPLMRDYVQPMLAQSNNTVPFFEGPQLGLGVLTASLVVALMVLPTITTVTKEVLRAVPNHLRESAWGLGATRWEAIRIAVLPSARSGILGGVVLGIGRALGETMAVTMVIGNQPEISSSLFSSGATMASVIASEFSHATVDLHISALSEIGLLLFLLTLAFNIAAQLLIGRVREVS